MRAAVLASRSTTFPCPGWSPWARLGWRAQPQVELGPCLEVRGVEVQGGLPPCTLAGSSCEGATFMAAVLYKNVRPDISTKGNLFEFM